MKAFYPTLALVIMTFSWAQAQNQVHVIEVSSFAFTPRNLQVAVGDTIRFRHVSGSHTATSRPSLPVGAAAFNFTMSNGAVADYVVTEPGEYPYFCVPHASSMQDTFRASILNSLQAPSPLQDIRLYPNPSREKLTFSFSLASFQAIEVQLISLAGQQVYAQTHEVPAGAHEIQVPIEALAPGVYTLHAFIGNVRHSERVVLE